METTLNKNVKGSIVSCLFGHHIYETNTKGDQFCIICKRAAIMFNNNLHYKITGEHIECLFGHHKNNKYYIKLYLNKGDTNPSNINICTLCKQGIDIYGRQYIFDKKLNLIHTKLNNDNIEDFYYDNKNRLIKYHTTYLRYGTGHIATRDFTCHYKGLEYFYNELGGGVAWIKREWKHEIVNWYAKIKMRLLYFYFDVRRNIQNN